MVFYTPLDLDKQIMEYGKWLEIDFGGKTYDEIFRTISEKCPSIYSQEELEEMCRENLSKILEKYGFRGLRVWYHAAKKNLMYKNLLKDEDGWGGDDPIERKYHNLIRHIWEYHNTELMFRGKRFLNVMLYFRKLEEVFREEYGSLLEKDLIEGMCNEVYHLMKTVHLAHYNEDVVKATLPYVKDYLMAYNCKYYLGLDLEDIDNLMDLYLHVAEENYDEDAYQGFTIFHSNDGWGNTVFDNWDSWTDEEGVRHSRLNNPKTSISDFKKKGSVYD